MDEYEVRITAFDMASEILGKEANVYAIIDYAEKIKMFVVDEWNSAEIKAELENRES